MSRTKNLFHSKRKSKINECAEPYMSEVSSAEMPQRLRVGGNLNEEVPVGRWDQKRSFPDQRNVKVFCSLQ